MTQILPKTVDTDTNLAKYPKQKNCRNAVKNSGVINNNAVTQTEERDGKYDSQNSSFQELAEAAPFLVPNRHHFVSPVIWLDAWLVPARVYAEIAGC